MAEPHEDHTDPTPNPVRVLSIDGGGIRGIIPAVLLAALEQQLERPIAHCFDLIAGTSTGGILALGLTVPDQPAPDTDPPARPRYSAAELLDMYKSMGPRIFKPPLGRPGGSLGRLSSRVAAVRGSKYSAAPLEQILKEFFADAPLSTAVTDVLIPAYDMHTPDPIFFKSRHARSGRTADTPMRTVARATSAAPTFFPPLTIPANAVVGREHAADDPERLHALIDGGVLANNPAMCAYAEARRTDPQRPVLVVSLGTGQRRSPIAANRAQNWWFFQWAKPLIDTLMDSASDTVNYQLQWILEQQQHQRHYYRFQIDLQHAAPAMDDASDKNIAALMTEGTRLLDASRDDLDSLATRLTPHPPQPP